MQVSSCVNFCSSFLDVSLMVTSASHGHLMTKLSIIVKHHLSDNSILKYLLSSPSSTECLALWPGEQAVLQKTSVTCLQRWTRSSRLWPSSTSSTKSCWDHSSVDKIRLTGELETFGRENGRLFLSCVIMYVCARTTVFVCTLFFYITVLMCVAVSKRDFVSVHRPCIKSLLVVK